MDFNFDISSVEAQCTFDTSVEVNTDTFWVRHYCQAIIQYYDYYQEPSIWQLVL